MKKIILISIVMIMSFAICAELSEWTVMVYMAADNKREEKAIEAINAMEEVGSGDGLNIVTFVDRWDGFEWKYLGGGDPVRVRSNKDYTGHGDWTGSKMFYIQEDASDEITSTELTEGQDISVNSGDPKNLVSFIDIVQHLYPAQNYAVIVWGLGGGLKGTIWDEDSGTFMPTYQLGKVFQKAIDLMLDEGEKKIDLVGFDSAFMSSFEVGYDLKSSDIKVMVGPEGNISWDGFPYKDFLGKIKEDISRQTDVTSEEIAQYMCESYVEKVQSDDPDSPYQIAAVSLNESKVDNVRNRLDRLSKLIMEDDDNLLKLHRAAERSIRFYYNMYTLDLADLMKNIKKEFDDSIGYIAEYTVKDITERGLVLANETNNHEDINGTTGLTIYFPLYRRASRDGVPYLVRPFSDDSEKYRKYAFAEDTAWDEMLEKYYEVMERQGDSGVSTTAASIVEASEESAASSPVAASTATEEEDTSQTVSGEPPTGKYFWPTDSHRITSPYGWRIHPVYGTRKMHWGIDIGAPTGHTIAAPRSGRVTYSGPAGTAGNMMIISHGGGKETVYMHCHRLIKGSGANVSVGEPVAQVGSTGASTGPHLHFETRENDERLDPLPKLVD
ncbi:MAG: clostripain-related cysteine peptidase [Candidatus Muiribacteriaceae bacterium]